MNKGTDNMCESGCKSCLTKKHNKDMLNLLDRTSTTLLNYDLANKTQPEIIEIIELVFDDIKQQLKDNGSVHEKSVIKKVI